MDKYLAGWQPDNKEWLKARKADWKNVKTVVERYGPRDREAFNKLKTFFLTGDLDFTNSLGYLAETLVSEHDDVIDDFDCALNGFHARVFLLLLFSPVQTDEMYQYVIATFKARDKQWPQKMADARGSYLSCAELYHGTAIARELSFKEKYPLAGREALLYKYLHGNSLSQDYQFAISKTQVAYVNGVLDQLTNIYRFCCRPYVDNNDYYQWYPKYIESCLDFVKDNRDVAVFSPEMAFKVMVYSVLEIVENETAFVPIKYQFAKEIHRLLISRTDDFPENLVSCIKDALSAWNNGEGVNEWRELKPKAWNSWKKNDWLDETLFDECGKPLNGDLQ